MANRPVGYGFTAEVKRKIANKYDTGEEIKVRDWIENVLGEELNGDGEPGLERFHKELKSGVVLCKLINAIRPNSVKKINMSKMAFKQMENIGNFLSACEALDIVPTDLFSTSDLYDKNNMGQVLVAIAALGRKAQKIGYDGPSYGVREAVSNPRNFSAEQLRAGNSVIGLQMGSNKGASQAGMSFGRARSINEHGKEQDGMQEK